MEAYILSTYWYFECKDHDPPLVSTEEFTQHTDDRNFIECVELAKHRPLPPDAYFRDYFKSNIAPFLHQHPNCNLGLVNEYGERRSLD